MDPMATAASERTMASLSEFRELVEKSLSNLLRIDADRLCKDKGDGIDPTGHKTGATADWYLAEKCLAKPRRNRNLQQLKNCVERLESAASALAATDPDRKPKVVAVDGHWAQRTRSRSRPSVTPLSVAPVAPLEK